MTEQEKIKRLEIFNISFFISGFIFIIISLIIGIPSIFIELGIKILCIWFFARNIEIFVEAFAEFVSTVNQEIQWTTKNLISRFKI